MKAHRAMGATLCIKNLFGLAPVAVYGAPRRYLHDRLIRLPRVLVDLVALFRPCLNVVDGIVAANHGEWHGTPVEAGVILAGHDIVATDAVGMKVMGFDPQGDYPDHPFFYRQNAVRLAAEAGLGVGDPAQIEAVGLDPAGVRQRFEVEPYGAGYEARQEELRRGAATVRRYREGRIAYLDGHIGRFAALKDGQLLWSTHDMAEMIAAERDRCKAYTEWPDFIVRVVPEEEEVEVLDAYAAWEG
jgi:hypothetical protein